MSDWHARSEIRKRFMIDKKMYEKSVNRLRMRLAAREARLRVNDRFESERDVRVDEAKRDVVRQALEDLDHGYTKEELVAKWSAYEESSRGLMFAALHTGSEGNEGSEGTEGSQDDVGTEIELNRLGCVAEYKTTLEVLIAFERMT